MPKETQPQKEHIKVTDKRIFTPDGQIREEFRDEIKPSDPNRVPAAPPAEERPERREQPPRDADQGRRRSVADKAASPGTPFANFVEPLIAQAYMNLGMLPNPYAPQNKPDVAAARQMIDILTLLQDKTAGNLTPDEDDFLSTHIGELKLAFVKRTKSI
ncbi:MAG TPA: DUF1844 domain-containing protein [Thermoanaerobaculia bacterium]|nr:DUF1844 domain-containing protein [Thermoanaerobaculia bacterium]